MGFSFKNFRNGLPGKLTLMLADSGRVDDLVRVLNGLDQAGATLGLPFGHEGQDCPPRRLAFPIGASFVE